MKRSKREDAHSRSGRSRADSQTSPAYGHVRWLNDIVEFATQLAIGIAAFFGVLRFFGNELVDFVEFARELIETLEK